jgi:2,4-dienoyl-CoA reductase-like NADH-dependent reductase (Old Yellow Enzyme family)
MQRTTPSKLFTSAQVGPVIWSHRVVMAPLTRMRSEQPTSPWEINRTKEV